MRISEVTPVTRKTHYLRNGRRPIPVDLRRSYNMSCIRSKNTKPELAFRKELRAQGLTEYRLHPKTMPGRPDVYFPSMKLAIFINGCFWHRCPYCKPSMPKTNKAFWEKKLFTNVLRDKENRAMLKKKNIRSIVLWECQINKNARKLATKLKSIL
jgi:DNA mismatch endonuclease (patch repair protein)